MKEEIYSKDKKASHVKHFTTTKSHTLLGLRELCVQAQLERESHSDQIVNTLWKTYSSNNSSYPQYDIHFLKQNEVYFHVGYAI